MDEKEAFHYLDNRVIIASRRKSVLQEVAETRAGLEFVVFYPDAPYQDAVVVRQQSRDALLRAVASLSAQGFVNQGH